MDLGSLIAPKGARKKRKRVGRGEGSGHGGTSGKGHKGQKARAGNMGKVGFEGGQMPLSRRLPKYGFHNPFRKEFAAINLDRLAALPAGTVVDEAYLKTSRLVKQFKDGIKLLSRGEVTVPLTIRLSRVSAAAKEKIVAAGGSVESVSE